MWRGSSRLQRCKQYLHRGTPLRAHPCQHSCLSFLTQPCFLCSSPGLTGSLAILGGLWLHINPYGNLHWSSDDLLVGMTCILPLLLSGKSQGLLNPCLMICMLSELPQCRSLLVYLLAGGRAAACSRRSLLASVASVLQRGVVHASSLCARLSWSS